MLLSLGVSWSLQSLAAWAWPQPVLSLPGVRLWQVASLALGACLTALALAPDRGKVRPGSAVLGLAFGAVLGVSLGSVAPGLGLLSQELGRVPPQAELGVLLSELQRLYAPLMMVLAALPGPLAISSLREARDGARWPAVVALVWVLALGAGLCWRANGWEGMSALLAQGRGAALGEPGLVDQGWAPLCFALVVVGTLGLVRQRSWLVAGAWLAAQVVLAEPVSWLGRSLYGFDDASLELPITAGSGPGSTLALLDLTASPPRYGGEPWGRALEVELAGASFWDQGPEFLVRRPIERPWHFGLQRAVHMAPPLQARCGEIVSTVSVLRRYGVSLWLWPGRPAERLEGPLGFAFEHPVVVVLTYPPKPSAEVPLCGVLTLEPGRLLDSQTGDVLVRLPDQLDEVPGLFPGCSGSVRVVPMADAPVASLFAVLDRLGGTHPDARFRERIAIHWPGLDDEAQPEGADSVLEVPGVRARESRPGKMGSSRVQGPAPG